MVRDFYAYENYDRQSFTLSAGHRFNSSYNLLFSSGYVRGLYDEAQVQNRLDENFTESDLEEFRIATTLETNLIEYHPLSLAYSYYGVDFDDVDRESNTINN